MTCSLLPAIFATHKDGAKRWPSAKRGRFPHLPFTEFPELLNEQYFGRSAWQIATIEVIDWTIVKEKIERRNRARRSVGPTDCVCSS